MSGHDCETCPVAAELAPMGVQVGGVDRVVALAGNPEHRQVAPCSTR